MPDPIHERRMLIHGLYVMFLLSLAIVSSMLTGCFPEPPHDCITEGGMYVKGGDCSAVAPVQDAIEAEAVNLGFQKNALHGALLWVRTDGLDSNGGFPTSEGAMAAGITYCMSSMMIVALPPNGTLGQPATGQDWKATAFAHEAFHVIQNCQFDQDVYNACKASGCTDCDFQAEHPNWTNTVYPAIDRITKEN